MFNIVLVEPEIQQNTGTIGRLCVNLGAILHFKPIRWKINMSFGDILYIIAIFLFAFITFGIVKNYYKSKFDDEGRRIDMQDDDSE